jgi:hypothetical protein
MKKILIATLFPLSLFGQTWSSFGGGTDASVISMCLNNNSTELFVGGNFNMVGNLAVGKLAGWSQGNWSDIDADMDYGVHALTYIDGKLYAGGEFVSAGGSAANRIAVYEKKVFQGELYAVGSFNQAGGLTANGIAKWDGVSWSVIGSGADNVIDVIEVWNNELYIGGLFTMINGVNASGIAKWNGMSIAAVGTGVPVVTIGWPNRVSAMEAIDDKLYVGGLFSSIDNVNANNIASYNGVSFQALGSGTNDHVYELKLFQNDLIAGGLFTQAGEQNAAYIAKWTNVLELVENDNINVSIYPVPSNGELTVDLEGFLIDNYTISSASGKIVRKNVEEHSSHFQISLEGEEAGVYFIEFKTSDNNLVTKRVVKS